MLIIFTHTISIDLLFFIYYCVVNLIHNVLYIGTMYLITLISLHFRSLLLTEFNNEFLLIGMYQSCVNSENNNRIKLIYGCYLLPVIHLVPIKLRDNKFDYVILFVLLNLKMFDYKVKLRHVESIFNLYIVIFIYILVLVLLYGD